MPIAGILTLSASSLAAAALQVEDRASAQLAVSATVVRPPEILTLAAAGPAPAAMVRNSETVTVLASGGTLIGEGLDTAVFSNGKTDALVLTIVY